MEKISDPQDLTIFNQSRGKTEKGSLQSTMVACSASRSWIRVGTSADNRISAIYKHKDGGQGELHGDVTGVCVVDSNVAIRSAL
jgi:hypothetical protein